MQISNFDFSLKSSSVYQGISPTLTFPVHYHKFYKQWINNETDAYHVNYAKTEIRENEVYP